MSTNFPSSRWRNWINTCWPSRCHLLVGFEPETLHNLNHDLSLRILSWNDTKTPQFGCSFRPWCGSLLLLSLRPWIFKNYRIIFIELVSKFELWIQFYEHFYLIKSIHSFNFSTVSRNGNEETFNNMVKLYNDTTHMEEQGRLVRVLGFSQDEAIIQKALDFCMSVSGFLGI